MTSMTRYPQGLSISAIVAIAGASAVMTLVLTALSASGGQLDDNALSLPLVIHIATVVPALPLGGYVLIRRKGDRLHKLLGRIWLMLMVTTAIDSFWIVGPQGQLSFIHLFSVLTLVTVPLSLWHVWRGNIRGHRRALQALYIGLVVAGAFAFLPGRFLGTALFG